MLIHFTDVYVCHFPLMGLESGATPPNVVVVVQLAEWSLPIPEDPGSNQAIGNFYSTYLLLTVCRQDKNKRKRIRELLIVKNLKPNVPMNLAFGCSASQLPNKLISIGGEA